MKLLKQTLRTIVCEIYKTVDKSPFTEEELDAHTQVMAEKYNEKHYPEAYIRNLYDYPFASDARAKLWYPLRDYAGAKKYMEDLYGYGSTHMSLFDFPDLLVIPPTRDWDGKKVDISYTNLVSVKGLKTRKWGNENEITQQYQFSFTCAHGKLSSLENIGKTDVTDITLIDCPHLTSLSGIEGGRVLEKVTLVDIPLDTLHPLLELPRLKFLSITRVDGYINDPSNVLSQLMSKGVKVMTKTDCLHSTRNE